MSEEESTASANMLGRQLGSRRWVQFGFMAGALLAWWLFDKIIYATWNLWAQPQEMVATSAAALLALVLAFVLYKVPKYNTFIAEVVSELTKVTWPTRKETWAQAIVVIIVSVIAAVILGLFDGAWAAVTDLIYVSS